MRTPLRWGSVRDAGFSASVLGSGRRGLAPLLFGGGEGGQGCGVESGVLVGGEADYAGGAVEGGGFDAVAYCLAGGLVGCGDGVGDEVGGVGGEAAGEVVVAGCG